MAELIKIISVFKKKLQKQTPKFRYIDKCFGQSAFALLDVGAGNFSASKTKYLFPNCEYHGIDLNSSYCYTEEDFKVLHSFYEMDLTLLDYKVIPDNYFDFIRMTHVIEHLTNGDEVIANLLPKLKNGGYIYIEYPGKRSTKLPSMTGTLNFYDDSSHVRIYTIAELKGILQKKQIVVLSCGTRRNIIFLLATPFRIVASLVRGKKLHGNIFWDLLGFAEFLFGRKAQY
jgi:SAM-dependent methyltransferase